MVIAVSNSGEEEIRNIVNQVAEICLSKEFNELRNELEEIYFKHGIENALLTAFQDALYAILAQKEGARSGRTHI